MKKVIFSYLLLLLTFMEVSTSNIEKFIPDNSLYKYAEAQYVEYLIKERLELGYTFEVQQKIYFISMLLGIEDQWLYNIFYLECRHNHLAVNLYTGATGLIQFMPNTAHRLGTSTLELLTMNKSEQLDYVWKYLKKFEPENGYSTMQDLYLAVFYPKAIGKTSYQFTHKVWKYNKGIDKKGNNDGILTIEDINLWINYNIS